MGFLTLLVLSSSSLPAPTPSRVQAPILAAHACSLVEARLRQSKMSRILPAAILPSESCCLRNLQTTTRQYLVVLLCALFQPSVSLFHRRFLSVVGTVKELILLSPSPAYHSFASRI